MSLSGAVLGGLISSNLAGVGAKGYNLAKFTSALGSGIVNSIKGKAFTTSDVGSVTGNGFGTGTGITGLSASQMASLAISDMFRTGPNAQKLMTAIMNATVSHLGSAKLTSVDFPVYLGTGNIVVGSIAVSAGEMTSNIDSQLRAVGAKGANLNKLAHAIATGITTNILSSGTGVLTITGTPISGPTPGTGSGTGVIS